MDNLFNRDDEEEEIRLRLARRIERRARERNAVIVQIIAHGEILEDGTYAGPNYIYNYGILIERLEQEIHNLAVNFNLDEDADDNDERLVNLRDYFVEHNRTLPSH